MSCRRAQIWKHSRSEQRSLLHPADQAGFHPTQRGVGDKSTLLLLLRRMIRAIRNYFVFLWRCSRVAFVGDWRYYAWICPQLLFELDENPLGPQDVRDR